MKQKLDFYRFGVHNTDLEHNVCLAIAAGLAEETAEVEADIKEPLDLMVGVGAGARRRGLGHS
jgi:hypothetical protein